MALSLQQLIAPLTREQHLARLLDSMRGIGISRRNTKGTGGLVLSGTPGIAATLLVRITSTGQLGAALWQASLDNGATWTPSYVTSEAPLAVLTSGVFVAFSRGEDATTAFVLGDMWTTRLVVSRLPAMSWSAFSLPRTVADYVADSSAERDELLANIASGGYLYLATGEWLTLYALHQYRVFRKPGTATIGTVVLTDTAGAGPYPTFAVGQLYAVTDGGLRYYNSTGGTLSKGSTLALSFTAESPGALYNSGNGSISTLETPIPGITVSNPALTSGGTWYTTQGTDPETDEDLRARCNARWFELAVEPPEDVYLSRAKAAAPEVTRAYARQDPGTPGRVLIDLAGPTGPVGASTVTAVDAALQKRKGITSTIIVRSAQSLPITVKATLYAYAGRGAQAVATAQAALTSRFTNLRLDGTTIYLTNLIEDLESPYTRNVTIQLPVADVSVAVGQAPALTTEFNIIEV